MLFKVMRRLVEFIFTTFLPGGIYTEKVVVLFVTLLFLVIIKPCIIPSTAVTFPLYSAAPSLLLMQRFWNYL